MAKSRYELAAAGEGQAPRRGRRKRCGPCPAWVWIVLLLVLLLLIGAAVGSYYARKLIAKSTIYPVDPQRLYMGGDGIVEGDMLGVNASSESAGKDPRLLWPLGRVPYRLDDDLGCPDSPRCDVLMDAILEFNNSTCLVWEPAKDSDKHAVDIKLEEDSGCYSSVGYRGVVGGEQVIVLGHGCFNKGIILHQMGHTVGFWHEHNRPDRDGWISLTLNNTDDKDSFEKYDVTRHPVSDSMDFESIMMYGPLAFSRNGESTLDSLWDSKPIPALQNKTALSSQDVDRLRYLYTQLCRSRAQQQNS